MYIYIYKYRFTYVYIYIYTYIHIHIYISNCIYICIYTCYDIVWYRMILYDIVWYCMIWYDMIWYDMIWYEKRLTDLHVAFSVIGICVPIHWPNLWILPSPPQSKDFVLSAAQWAENSAAVCWRTSLSILRAKRDRFQQPTWLAMSWTI